MILEESELVLMGTTMYISDNLIETDARIIIMNWEWHLPPIVVASILVPCHVVKSLQLI